MKVYGTTYKFIYLLRSFCSLIVNGSGCFFIDVVGVVRKWISLGCKA